MRLGTYEAGLGRCRSHRLHGFRLSCLGTLRTRQWLRLRVSGCEQLAREDKLLGVCLRCCQHVKPKLLHLRTGLVKSTPAARCSEGLRRGRWPAVWRPIGPRCPTHAPASASCVGDRRIAALGFTANEAPRHRQIEGGMVKPEIAKTTEPKQSTHARDVYELCGGLGEPLLYHIYENFPRKYPISVLA